MPLAGVQSLTGRKGQVSHACVNVKALNSAARHGQAGSLSL